MTTTRTLAQRVVGLVGVLCLVGGALLAVGGVAAPAGADPHFDHTAYDAHLKGAHHGARNPGFEQECEVVPGVPAGSYVWHFVFPGNDTEFVSLSVAFANAGELHDVDFVAHPSAKHAYVVTDGPDQLLDAVAMTSGGTQTEFNLSHVCPGTTTTTEPTTTTEGATTTEEPGPTVAPTGLERPEATVEGAVVERPGPLPRTGAPVVPLVAAGLALMGVGAAALRWSRTAKAA